jgi:hypothetical protein
MRCEKSRPIWYDIFYQTIFSTEIIAKAAYFYKIIVGSVSSYKNVEFSGTKYLHSDVLL